MTALQVALSPPRRTVCLEDRTGRSPTHAPSTTPPDNRNESTAGKQDVRSPDTLDAAAGRGTFSAPDVAW